MWRWKVGRALALAFAAAVLVAGGIFYGLVALLDVQEIDSTARLDASTLFDLVKLPFGVVAGAGTLVSLVVAYRRQRVDEAGAHGEATRLHTERFSQAVDKLGSDSPAARLGGVHAEEHHRYLAPSQSPAHHPAPHQRPLPAPQGTHRSWQGCDLDLTDVAIDGTMDFSGTRDGRRRHGVFRRRDVLRQLGVFPRRWRWNGSRYSDAAGSGRAHGV
ncbi:hypothetical protein ABZ835_32790 [Streptomyces sp. NPDC047461]|uniref:hypothetical protein n=1 Tax=Streptomyces sp. NPDC047461 TaxID=3155619 RepID=UPI0033D17673